MFIKKFTKNGRKTKNRFYRETIELIDFCCLDSFLFEKDGQTDRKDLYIYVFNSKNKIDLIKPQDENLYDVGWFKYEEALSLISFNKNELIPELFILLGQSKLTSYFKNMV